MIERCRKCGKEPGLYRVDTEYMMGVKREEGDFCCSVGPFAGELSAEVAMDAWGEMQRATPVSSLISLPIEEACARKHADGVREHRDSEADGFQGDPDEEAFSEAIDGINYCREAQRMGRDRALILCFFMAAEMALQDAVTEESQKAGTSE